MSKHGIANEIDGVRINEQVKAENKLAFYADDEIWDHEFCADGEACGDECIYTND